MSALLRVFVSFTILWCGASSQLPQVNHDPQFIQIFYQTRFFDELDTFHGTYQKDLGPDTAKTEMWLTTREQEIILTKLEGMKFFSFPDVLDRHALLTTRQAPNLSL